MKIIAALAIGLLAVNAQARDWSDLGYAARVSDAQVACSNIDSQACEPYLAEALGVSATLQESAGAHAGRDWIGIAFHNGHIEHCTAKWYQSLNGLALLQYALARASTNDLATNRNTYWIDALIAAAQRLCHSH